MTDNTNTTDDPAIIEQDIRRTQEDMSRTVDRIGDQLTFRNIFNGVLDKADESNIDARYLIDGARRNPMALGLIAAGAIWLVSDKDSKFPTIKKGSSQSNDDELDLTGYDVHHRDYVSHMSSVEIREGEDHDSYLRRRDNARATFLMCERDPDEDDKSFRERLNAMTDSFREKRRAWSDSASETASRAGSSASDMARTAATRTQDAYDSNPLVGGILAAALGAALGSTLPVSRKEQEKLGSVGLKARDMASEQKDQLASQVREKKDELLLKADQKLQPADEQRETAGASSDFGSSGGFSGEPSTGSSGFGSGGQPNAQSQTETPFIISDRDR